MVWLVVFAIIAVIFVIAAIGFITSKGNRQARQGAGGIAAIALVVALVWTALFSFTTVDARAVGVQTGFGKYMDTLDNGLHVKAPYSSVEQFSTQIQYLDLDGEGQNVPVTFQGGGGGWVNATVRWRIEAEDAEQLWAKYKTFENVQDQLVAPASRDSLRVTVSGYTPNEAREGGNLRTITEDTQKDLDGALADDGVIIDSITVSNITLDDRAQEALDRVVAANTDIERARAEQERARIDNETAILRQESLTGAALQRYCLEVTNNWNVSKNGPLPATFNCGLNTTETPVIVQQPVG